MEFNGIAAHEFFEISLLQGHITERNFDIYFSKTFLNFSNDSEYGRLKIEGYNLMRADHASRSKKGGVCVYYKKYIPLVRSYELCTLSSCLLSAICLKSKKCFHICLYQSTSQIQHKFENFCTNLETLMDPITNELPIYLVITGNLNARRTKWCNKDNTISAGREIDTLTSSAGYNQIIKKLTHIV